MTAQFDLLSNPFAILGVSVSASRAEIDAAIDDALFDDDSAGHEQALERARQVIGTPRTRLAAELAFLPGADAQATHAVLETLRRGADSDLAGDLGGLDRANILAHRCAAASGDIAARRARTLVLTHDDVRPQDVTEQIARARARSGFGAVPPEDLQTALNLLREQHAAIVVDALIAHPTGLDDMARLASDLADKPPARRDFVRKVIARYESAITPRLHSAEQAVDNALEQAETASDDDALTAIATALRAWDRLAQPLQLADRAMGLDEPHSRALFGRVRTFCVDQANIHDRHELALELVGVAQEVFAELRDAMATLEEDATKLLDIVTQQRREEAIAPLVAAVTAAQNDLPALARVLNLKGFAGNAGAAVGPMVAALDVVIAQGRPDMIETAILLVRGLAIDLYNEAHEATAALAITKALQAHRNLVPHRVRQKLDEDLTTLERHLQLVSMKTALDSGDLDRADALVIGLLDRAPAEEVEALHSMRDLIAARRKDKRGSMLSRLTPVAILAGIIGFFALADLLDTAPQATEAAVEATDTGYVTDEAPPQPPPAAPSDPASDLAYAGGGLPQFTPPVMDTSESAPPISYSEQTLALPQVRYCVRQKARLQSVANSITSDEESERFNTAVDDFNSRCSQFRYNTSDMTTVESEIATSGAQLRREGQAILEGTY